MARKADKADGPRKPGPVTEEVFRTYIGIRFSSFDLDGFDAWLSELHECGAKQELLERRRLAIECVTPPEINVDALRNHLEWMMLRWRGIERERFLLPLAKVGKPVDEARRKPKRPELQQWIDAQVAKASGETALDLWNRAPDWITEQIGFDRFTKRVTVARKAAGISRK